MTRQPAGPLFERPAVRHDAPRTSREAAVAHAPRQTTARFRVLAAIAQAGVTGATRDEVSEATGLSPNTVRPRWRELEQAGWIVYAEFDRKTETGCRSEVWVATHTGLEIVRREEAHTPEP